jgi:hypothetical protein
MIPFIWIFDLYHFLKFAFGKSPITKFGKRKQKNDQKIDTEKLQDRLNQMTERERVEILDPICKAVQGKVELYDGLKVMANRIFALAVLNLYKKWQREMYERN